MKKTLSIAAVCVVCLVLLMVFIPKSGPSLPPGLTFAQSNQNNFGGNSGGPGSFTTLTATGAISSGAAGGTTGTLNLLGSTSGTASCTAPAIAGTSTNGITCSNVLILPIGAVGTPTIGFAGDTNTGFYGDSSGTGSFAFTLQGTKTLEMTSASGQFFLSLPNNSTKGLTFGSSVDANIWRMGTGILGFGSGAASDTTAKLKASGYMSVGTKFTASGCANTTLVGGSTAGTYTSVTAGSCTVTITFGDAATAPNGWACDAHDLTTVADANNVTMGSSNGTTANLVEGTVAASDVISFKCIGY